MHNNKYFVIDNNVLQMKIQMKIPGLYYYDYEYYHISDDRRSQLVSRQNSFICNSEKECM